MHDVVLMKILDRIEQVKGDFSSVRFTIKAKIDDPVEQLSSRHAISGGDGPELRVLCINTNKNSALIFHLKVHVRFGLEAVV